MDINYNNCDSKMAEQHCDCNFEYYSEEVNECNKYKQKSDELYIKATYMQNEVHRLSYEAKELEHYAKELEYQAKQLCAQANIVWANANKLECEVKNTLDLASFYCNKSIDCYKNLNNTTSQRPKCSNYNSCL